MGLGDLGKSSFCERMVDDGRSEVPAEVASSKFHGEGEREDASGQGIWLKDGFECE